MTTARRESFGLLSSRIIVDSMVEGLQAAVSAAADRGGHQGNSVEFIPSAAAAARHRRHLRGARPHTRLRRIEAVVARCSSTAEAMGAPAAQTAQARQWPRPVGGVGLAVALGLASLRTADRHRHLPTEIRHLAPNSIRIWRCPIWDMPTIPCPCTMGPMAVGVCMVVLCPCMIVAADPMAKTA